MSNLENICIKVCEIAAETGRFIINESGKFMAGDIKSKGIHDYVTYVDIESEKMLTAALGDLLPEAVFITEEETILQEKGKICWIIDPLDGTTNFMHGLPPYSISVALAEGEKILAGVVYSIAARETFWAWDKGGAWLDGEAIKVSRAARIEDSLIATGFPYKDFDSLGKYLTALEYFIRNSHGVRRMGSAAIDLANVACGRFDAFYEYNLNRWDVSAGILLIREAGGIASDFSGNQVSIDGSEIVAANNLIFEEFRAKVNTFMTKLPDNG